MQRACSKRSPSLVDSRKKTMRQKDSTSIETKQVSTQIESTGLAKVPFKFCCSGPGAGKVTG